MFKRYFAILRGEMEAVDCTVTAQLGKDTESTAWNRNVVLQDPLQDTDAQPASHETHHVKPKWRDIWIRAVFWSRCWGHNTSRIQHNEVQTPSNL